MSLFPQPAIIGASEYSKGYPLEDSLRLRSSASAYLNRTPASAGNRKTWTWSGWVKRGNLTTSYGKIWAAGVDNTGAGTNIANSLFFHATEDRLEWSLYGGGYIATNAKYRDPSAWYHIVLSIDTTQSTASDRIKIYVNGIQETLTGTYWMSLNTDYAVNNTTQHSIGKRPDEASSNFDGYLTEINFIDGQALDPSYFGQTDDVTGVWKPKKYTGTYGTNGFYLPMTPTSQASGFNTVTYTGNGVSGQSITGVGFQPDLVWMKSRNNIENSDLEDSVRGAGKSLRSSATTAEQNLTGQFGITTFDNDGFTLIDQGSRTNSSGWTYVAWCWDAGSGSPASNTDGTITSTVKANQAKGFSIITYTGNGTNGSTIGHGLGIAPSMIIVKGRSTTDGWPVYHTSISNTQSLRLNTTAAPVTAGFWNNTTAGSSVFTVGGGTVSETNTTSATYVAYCFAEVAGYSKIGSYTGNGSTSGPTITTGFRTGWIMVKRTDTLDDWFIFDSGRDSGNPKTLRLKANATDAEGSGIDSFSVSDTTLQLVSSNQGWNASGGTYIYMAIADTRNTAFNNDASGNQNNWTPNNINSNASGQSTYDLMKDVPTLTDADAGNFATLNPLAQAYGETRTTTSNGNLDFSDATSSNTSVIGTILPTSGKWYFEMTATASGVFAVGLYHPSTNAGSFYRNNGYYSSAFGGGGVAGYSSWTTNDKIAVAWDADAGKIWYAKNNTWQSGDPSSGTSPTNTFTVGYGLAALISTDNSAGTKAGSFNFGQRPFAYTPPTGFKALNTYNLPDPTIEDGSDYFNTVLYTGDGTSSHAITGVGFSPSLTWLKQRNGARDNTLFDVVRGATKQISSNLTNAESTQVTMLTSFDADGFTVGSDNPANISGGTFVSWNWKANGSGVSNTAGSITSTVSANTSSGFSIVTYTGVTGAQTVGHGLGIAPSLIFVKQRSGGAGWRVYSSQLANTQALELNATSGAFTQNVWNNTSPTSSVFSISDSAGTWTNSNGATFVAYCFTPISGYSAFGQYAGNGSTDGPFVYTGFRPAFILFKCNQAGTHWNILDADRNTYNLTDRYLRPNTAEAEATTYPKIDILSNGFKCRNANDDINYSGYNTIYAAFAENPFKYSLAR